MKHVYKAALKLSYVISDLAEFILDPIVNAVWNLGGRIECWAHTNLTKLEADTLLDIDAPTGWVGHDRYRESIAAIEAEMRRLKEQGIKPEEFEGMSVAQVYNKLSDELVDDVLKGEG
jgi:hypothetical protein